MKILHIVSNLSIRSGIMSVLMNYYRNMDTKKISFEFLYFDEREITYKEEIKTLGGAFYKIERTFNPIKLRNDIRDFLVKHSNEYSVVHLHEVYLIGFLIGLRSHIGRVVVHAHATRFSENKLNGYRNRIMALPNKFFPDYYFACSYDAGRKIFGKKFNKYGQVINNAIDLNKFHRDCMIENEYRKMLDISEKFVVGHIGNFTVPKNHFFIIDIFHEIQKQRKDAVLVLVGDGERREQIENKCILLGISDKVKFLGVRTDVNKIMNTFDCFILPSIYEGLGIVLIEAQATGIPCVFSDVVPREANILKESNQILNINDSASIWASAVLESNEIARDNISNDIRKAGYDIVIEAKKLEEIYKNMQEDLEDEL